MIRWLVPTALVLAMVLLALVLAPWLTGDASDGQLVLVEISGDVGVASAEGSVEPAQAGRVVQPSEQLRTGPASSAVLSAGPDTEIRLSPSTALTVESIQDDVVTVELDEGRIRADVRGGRRGVRVANQGRSVETSDGSVAVAIQGGVLAVEVDRGTATTDGIDGVSRLTAGGRAVVLSEGEVALGAIPDEVALSVAWPAERRTRADQVIVRGKTQPGATVTVTGGRAEITAIAGVDGQFEATIELVEGAHPVVVQATDPFGRQVAAEARLERDTTPPSIGGGGLARDPPEPVNGGP